MKEETRKVYHCAYCNEYYLRRNAAIKHEERCRNNPKNQHACWGCKHLKMIEIEFCPDYGENRKFKSFVCSAKNDLPMYSVKAEYKEAFPQMLADMQEHDEQGREPVRMPLECELYNLNLPF